MEDELTPEEQAWLEQQLVKQKNEELEQLKTELRAELEPQIRAEVEEEVAQTIKDLEEEISQLNLQLDSTERELARVLNMYLPDI